MKTFVFAVYYLIGFTDIFGSCCMLRRVFRIRTRGFFLFSLAAGPAAPLYVLIHRLACSEMTGISPIVLGIILIPLIWVFITDRSLKSLAACISGYTFTVCTGAVLIGPVNLLTDLFIDRGFAAMAYISMLLGQLVTVGAIILIGRAGNSRMTEPMSIWSIMFVGLLALFTEQLTLIAQPGNELKSLSAAEALKTVTVSLMAVAFIVISVIMTVKFIESRYYSTLNSMNESYLNAQKDYYEVKQASDTEIRRIKHDMKNHLICIRDLAAQGKYEELEQYISEITETVSEADRLIHTGSGIIDAIVNEKAALAKKAGVRFEWEGTVSGLVISAVDSCTLVANLLDNALEACDKVDVAKRYISLSFRRSEHFLLMTCENSAPRVVELSGGRPLSSKSDRSNHGFGLENIERCIEKYGGHLDLSSGLEDGEPMFRAEAVIPLE